MEDRHRNNLWTTDVLKGKKKRTEQFIQSKYKKTF